MLKNPANEDQIAFEQYPGYCGWVYRNLVGTLHAGVAASKEAAISDAEKYGYRRQS